MKRSLLMGAIFLGLSAGLLLAAPPVGNSWPADVNTMTFSGIGVSNGTPLSWFIAPAVAAGEPRFQQIHAYSDKATAKLQFYWSTNSGTCTNGSIPAGTNTIWGNGFTNFAANDICVVQYGAAGTNGANSDFYERLKVSGTPTSSNIVFTTLTSWPVTYGDKVHKMTTAGTIPMFSLTNVTLSASHGLHTGPPGKPVLMDLDATTVGAIYGVSGDFYRRLRP